MKKILLFLIIGLFFGSTSWAQSTAINYQGTARDAANTLLNNQQISIQISIIQGTADGTAIYIETHTTNTSPTGLFTVAIGRGTLVSGMYEAIEWGGNAHFVEVALDPTGGTNFSPLGQVELLSVPYAFYAHSVGEMGGQGEQGEQGDEGEEGPPGDVGPQGPQGEQGIQGPPGHGGGKGPTGEPGLRFQILRNAVPENPTENDVYLDNGNNRADGTPGLRYFDGTDWIDL